MASDDASEAGISLSDLDLASALAGGNLTFVVRNGGADMITTGDRHGLWREVHGTAMLVAPLGPVQNNLYSIAPGAAREFSLGLPDPLPAGRYTIVTTVNRRSPSGGVNGDPVELRVSFDLPAHPSR